MDLLETRNVQTLIDALHEYLEYEQRLKRFMLAWTENKEQLKQQRLGFVVKCFKEFGIANVTILEAIN